MVIHKTTILFISTSGSEAKMIRVPAVIIQNWKIFLYSFSILFISVIFLLGEFMKTRTEAYYQSVYREKLQHSGRDTRAADLRKAKKSFESIDSGISRINHFMELRGLKSFKLQNIYTAEKLRTTNLDEASGYYVKQIMRLEKLIKNIPIGKPHEGEQTSGFGYRHNPFGNANTENHRGIDFRGNIGSAVRTTANGKVVFAGLKGGYGNCIIVRHINNLETLYGHLSRINVKTGEYVQAGSVIGALGNTGRSTGPHLHYEIMLNEKKINPKDYLTL
jgi:murein DD-endopeptidase MepM/ murein hydrolase activator NlpD